MAHDAEIPMRTFVDESGTQWEVREIHVPTLAVVPKRFLPHPEYAEGWLLFSTARERRRIAPVPSDWMTRPSTELSTWCANAMLVREATRPTPIFPAPEERQEERQL
jgi:hypothetical protein